MSGVQKVGVTKKRASRKRVVMEVENHTLTKEQSTRDCAVTAKVSRLN